MNEKIYLLIEFFFYLFLLSTVIGIPYILIKSYFNRKKSLRQSSLDRKGKNSNSLRKGAFELTSEEEEKGVIGFNIAGIFYRDSKDQIYSEILMLKLGDEFFLEPEPKNRHDEFAIKVLSTYSTHFGYVPRYLTYKFRDEKNNHIYHKCILHGTQLGGDVNVFIKCYPIHLIK